MNARGDDPSPRTPPRRVLLWLFAAALIVHLGISLFEEDLPKSVSAVSTILTVGVFIGVPIYHGVRRGQITEESAMRFFRISAAMSLVYAALLAAFFAAAVTGMLLARGV